MDGTTELSFSDLDEIARATLRGRIDPGAHLKDRRVARLGPFIELLLFDRAGTLPLSALSAGQERTMLDRAQSAGMRGSGAYVAVGESFAGFIQTDRVHTVEGSPELELRWQDFRNKARQAAERCFPKTVAQGFIGVMSELEENIHLHSGRPKDGVVAFRGSPEAFEFVVADSGMGMLASLQSSPDYRDLADTGKALMMSLQDGVSRLSHVEPHRGYGFRNLFRNLANLNGALRFRSDDQAVVIDGIAPELARARLVQLPRLRGFCASIVCRPRPGAGIP